MCKCNKQYCIKEKKRKKDLHLKYEIALEKLEISAAKCHLQFCWVIHTSLIHGSIHVRITDMFGLLFDTHLNTLRLYIVFNINKKNRKPSSKKS